MNSTVRDSLATVESKASDGICPRFAANFARALNYPRTNSGVCDSLAAPESKASDGICPRRAANSALALKHAHSTTDGVGEGMKD
ncbi:MAG: hypothetical protein EXS10_03960 [Phycisphaerales bacterium]|nr:hypothetical protein [Phycisphaerales bacterium]